MINCLDGKASQVLSTYFSIDNRLVFIAYVVINRQIYFEKKFHFTEIINQQLSEEKI